jgi:hypothetical protein
MCYLQVQLSVLRTWGLLFVNRDTFLHVSGVSSSLNANPGERSEQVSRDYAEEGLNSALQQTGWTGYQELCIALTHNPSY